MNVLVTLLVLALLCGAVVLIRLLVDAVLTVIAALAWLLRFAFSRPQALRVRNQP
jgi:hypothetical protein